MTCSHRETFLDKRFGYLTAFYPVGQYLSNRFKVYFAKINDLFDEAPIFLICDLFTVLLPLCFMPYHKWLVLPAYPLQTLAYRVYLPVQIPDTSSDKAATNCSSLMSASASPYRFFIAIECITTQWQHCSQVHSSEKFWDSSCPSEK